MQQRGQAGLLHLRAVGRISTFPQCRQDGVTNITGWQSCLNVGAQFSGPPGSCASYRAVPKAPITQEDTSYHPQRSPRNGGPWHSRVSTRNFHRVISRGKTRRGSPSPSLCAQPGLSQRYRLYSTRAPMTLRLIILCFQVITSQTSVFSSQAEEASRKVLSPLCRPHPCTHPHPSC